MSGKSQGPVQHPFYPIIRCPKRTREHEVQFGTQDTSHFPEEGSFFPILGHLNRPPGEAKIGIIMTTQEETLGSQVLWNLMKDSNSLADVPQGPLRRNG